MKRIIYRNLLAQECLSEPKVQNTAFGYLYSGICYIFSMVIKFFSKIAQWLDNYDEIIQIMKAAAIHAMNLVSVSLLLFHDLYGILFLYSDSVKYWFCLDFWHYLIVILVFIVVTLAVVAFIGMEYFWVNILLSYFLSVCVLSSIIAKPNLLICSFIGIFGIVFLFSILSLFIRKRGRKFKNIKLTLARIIFKAIKFGGIFMPVISCFYFGNLTVIQLKRNLTEKDAIHNVRVSETYITDNKTIFEKFKKENWIAMSISEKEIAGMELCQINLIYLLGRKDTSLRFTIREDYNPEAGGLYSEHFNEIVADYKYIADRDYMINLICHESYHYFQHRVRQGESDLHMLIPKASLLKYEEEFTDYIDINQDFDGYYNQQIEIDARHYANTVQSIYLGYIDNILSYNVKP